MGIGADDAGTDFSCGTAIPRTAELDVVHDDDVVLAVHRTRPLWRTHVVVSPKRHLPSFTTATPVDAPSTLMSRSTPAHPPTAGRAVSHRAHAPGGWRVP